jgi:hypothetical protein
MIKNGYTSKKSKPCSKKSLNLCSQKPENLSSCKKFTLPLMLKNSIKMRKKLLGVLQSSLSSICSNAEKNNIFNTGVTRILRMFFQT